mgnify:CR=1 FL=1
MQMKGLGLIFQDFFGIFDFYQFLNVLQPFEHSPDPDFREYRKIPKMSYIQAKR